MDTDFAQSVRVTRVAAGLTLDKLAELSGVSRAALSKIERGQRNPSLGNALRIADALQTPLAELVGHVSQPVTVVRAGEAPSLVDPGSGALRESLLEPQPGTELLRYHLPPHAGPEQFPRHRTGTRESYVVLAGEVTIGAGDLSVDLAAGDVAMLPGDRPHEMRNRGDEEATLLVLLLEPQ